MNMPLRKSQLTQRVCTLRVNVCPEGGVGAGVSLWFSPCVVECPTTIERSVLFWCVLREELVECFFLVSSTSHDDDAVWSML